MSDRVYKQERQPPRAHEAWGDVGATLARLGVPIQVAPAIGVDLHEPELPLHGGGGLGPVDLETKRYIAAVIRRLYDDVYDYAVEEPRAEEAAPPDEGAAQESAEQPAPVEVEAVDRKTGKRIKVRVNVVPPAGAQPAAASGSR